MTGHQVSPLRKANHSVAARLKEVVSGSPPATRHVEGEAPTVSRYSMVLEDAENS